MLLNHQYRAYPETQQKLKLNSWLRTSRYWYNWQLRDRFEWWEKNRDYTLFPQGEFCYISCSLPPKELRDKPNFYSQKKLLPDLKEDFIKVGHSGELLDFKSVPSQTLQDVSKRVELAFNRFVKGDSNAKKSGKPRFKNAASFRTMRFEGQAVTIERVEKDWLFLSISKLPGWLKVRLHRPLADGFTLKSVLLTSKADGWYCTITLEDPTVPVFNHARCFMPGNPEVCPEGDQRQLPTPVNPAAALAPPCNFSPSTALAPDDITPTWDNSLGMDAVLHEDDYLATSEGEKLPSLKSFRKSQARLAKVSKRKATKKKGSASRRKLAKREAREHQRIARSRKDHAYKTAHKLVRTGKKVFFHEDLNLQGLTKRNKTKKDEQGKFLPNGQSAKSGLNKSWLDAGFGQFFTTLDYIASKAGAAVVKVNPAYTSQLLAYRDELVFTDCAIRSYFDHQQLLYVDRDVNASINIKRVGLGLFPTIKCRKGKVVITSTATASTSKEVLIALSRVSEAHTDCLQQCG
ncbi:transposase [Aetokthonos hydrillicola Thurmond2011]|uniref:Transposase n=1 Tax=Aetokthonos hydrillicola Thurmond2011 TaxID=2712845 RepID=A0AAP5IGK9_9CYAN|nr:transposase [Aetokthonos hydrillicola]MDR9894848.1 transposase [Aetokthonos hydrillicola Thurmond2011]MDR9899443.1 transposase [Aetokthonos hydrillicola Thurmond2011]